MKQFDWLTSIVGNCKLFVNNDSLLLLDDEVYKAEVYNALSLHGRLCYISAWTPLIHFCMDAFVTFLHGRLCYISAWTPLLHFCMDTFVISR